MMMRMWIDDNDFGEVLIVIDVLIGDLVCGQLYEQRVVIDKLARL